MAIKDNVAAQTQLFRLLVNGGYNAVRMFQEHRWLEDETYRVKVSTQVLTFIHFQQLGNGSLYSTLVSFKFQVLEFQVITLSLSDERNGKVLAVFGLPSMLSFLSSLVSRCRLQSVSFLAILEDAL